MAYKLSTDGTNLIKKSEGFSLKFYGDPKGFPTVGWGHLITSAKVYTKNTPLSQADADALSTSLNLGYTSPITQSMADTFFDNDTARAIAAVNSLVLPANCQLSQNQFDALVSLTFNGGTKVLQTPDVVTMLTCVFIYPTYYVPLTQSEIDTCSKLVSKAFSYDINLQNRRNEEATLFCKGMQYTHKYPVYTL